MKGKWMVLPCMGIVSLWLSCHNGFSVSSEHAFSSSAITITKRRNRLKGDVVEALQVLKAALRSDLLIHEHPQRPNKICLARGGGSGTKWWWRLYEFWLGHPWTRCGLWDWAGWDSRQWWWIVISRIHKLVTVYLWKKPTESLGFSPSPARPSPSPQRGPDSRFWKPEPTKAQPKPGFLSPARPYPSLHKWWHWDCNGLMCAGQ